MTVTFLVVSSGTKVEKTFDSYYIGMKFVNKIKHSKKVRFISYSVPSGCSA